MWIKYLIKRKTCIYMKLKKNVLFKKIFKERKVRLYYNFNGNMDYKTNISNELSWKIYDSMILLKKGNDKTEHTNTNRNTLVHSVKQAKRKI